MRQVPELLRDASVEEEVFELPKAPEGEDIVWDYASTGLTLRRHPMALLRDQVSAKGYLSSVDLQGVEGGEMVNACGIVTLRQQPETAKGQCSFLLEDEHGAIQVIVWKIIREKQRKELLDSSLLVVFGEWQVVKEIGI